MTRKIAKTLHLTAGQWKTLAAMQQLALSSGEDESVRRVARIVEIVAKGGGTASTPPTLIELRQRGVRMGDTNAGLDMKYQLSALVEGDTAGEDVRAYATCQPIGRARSLGDSDIQGASRLLPCRYDSNPETDSCSLTERRACKECRR